MNPLLVGAALLALATGIAHSALGERYILTRLFRRENLPKLFGSDRFTKRTLRFAWHLTSLAWWGLGATLLVLGRPDAPARVAEVVAATFGLTGLVAGVASRGRHLSWIAFGATAALAWLGAP